MLIIASIQTLKRGNKKCGKDGIFRWFRYPVDDVTKETFDKLLELLIQKQSSEGCHVRTLQPQSIDILTLYIKSNFLRFHCGTITLQTKSKLTFWCNVSTNLSNCKNWFCSRKKTLLVQGRKIRNNGVGIK